LGDRTGHHFGRRQDPARGCGIAHGRSDGLTVAGAPRGSMRGARHKHQPSARWGTARRHTGVPQMRHTHDVGTSLFSGPAAAQRGLHGIRIVGAGLSAMVGAGVFAVVAPAARATGVWLPLALLIAATVAYCSAVRSEEHTSELQSRENLVCRLLLEKKNTIILISEHMTTP